MSIEAALGLLEKADNHVLGLTVGKHVVQPGHYIPRAEAQQPPQVSFAAPDQAKTYMLHCLDLDAPFPSLPVLGPILHWIQPGLRSAGASDGARTLLQAGRGVFPLTDYIPPAPPPGSAPHRYCFFLYEQPAGFVAAEHALAAEGEHVSNWKRMRFSLDGWVKKAGLGEVLAVNYFLSN